MRPEDYKSIPFPANIYIERYGVDEAMERWGAADRRDLLRGCEYAFKQLPERYRIVLEYRLRDCLTFRQIGDKMNITPARVQQLVSRGIRILFTGGPDPFCRSSYVRNGWRKGLAIDAKIIESYHGRGLPERFHETKAILDKEKAYRENLMTVRWKGEASV